MSVKYSLNKRKTSAKHPLDCVFGVQVDGLVYHVSLGQAPHLIVAGQTGSGKSVFVNAMIVSIMNHAEPSEVNFFMIDPKNVEFSNYEGLPYCPIPPITNMDDAYGFMKYQTHVMDYRYGEFVRLAKTIGQPIKNIEDYNEALFNYKDTLEAIYANDESFPKFLRYKYYVIVIDEYADLFMQNPDVEDEVIRIGQKARAAGIHMIIATQRPSGDIVSPNIKANIPSRICLKVVDGNNSNIILDETGGELLRGWGDALIKMNGESGLIRVQGTFINNKELSDIFDYLKNEFGQADFLDWKTLGVEAGLFEFAEQYDQKTPWEDKRVKSKSGSRGMGW